MIFGDKTIDEITDEEIDSLVQERSPERQHLEFKARYDIKDGADKLEVLRDIASLANGGGGYLIVGMQDNGKGQACGYVPEKKEHLEKIKQSIQQLCIDHIADRIPHMELKIRAPKNNPILVIKIPDSTLAPHMVTLERRTDFYTRYNDGKREMSVSEIRRGFQADNNQTMLTTMGTKLDKILENQANITPAEIKITPKEDEQHPEIMQLILKPPTKHKPVQFFPSKYVKGSELVEAVFNNFKETVKKQPYLWLAITPDDLSKETIDVNSRELREVLGNPPGSRRSGWNMEGSEAIEIIAEGITKGDVKTERLTLYTNGHMDFCTPTDEHFCWRQNPEEYKNSPELYPYPVIEYPTTFLRLYKAIIMKLSVTNKYSINLRYLNIKGFRLRPYSPKQAGYMFADKLIPYPFEDLSIPPEMVDKTFNPDILSHKLLTKVYTAFGLSSDTIPFYQDDHFTFPS
ncbi:MAG: ATP-binding protein [Dehalococcoidia bacterium]|jgi:hypothetical protein